MKRPQTRERPEIGSRDELQSNNDNPILPAADTDANAMLLRYMIVGLAQIVARGGDAEETRSLAPYAITLAERLDALAGGA